MRKYIVSIVGRPNVGKSTLFNRLCRKRSAIVDPEAGITRDRKYEDVEWNGKVFKIVDTGGIVFDSGEAMDKNDPPPGATGDRRIRPHHLHG